MKLIIQIPCFNEAEQLPETLAALPRTIEGIDTIEYLVVDDGSSDDSAEVARQAGVHHVVRHRTNRGLAAAFSTALAAALANGADIIVNTDADNQYDARDIEKLVRPILDGEADVVIGDRGVARNAHFGVFKRLLQRLGSFVVRSLAGVDISDAVSGFRAMRRTAAQRINVTTNFSYTTEMLIQVGRQRMAVTSVPVRTNGPVRPSRLFRSIPHFISQTAGTIIRAWTMYYPLRAFFYLGSLLAIVGVAPIVRFVWFYLQGDGAGHIQSLIIGGVLMILGVIAILLGVLADLIGRNRRILEEMLVRMRELEDRERRFRKTDPEGPGAGRE